MRLYDYAASGNCFKVRLLLRLAGVRCDLVPTDIFAGATLTDAYARLNPLRETPVLELDDGSTLTQSGAILGFLAEGTPYLPTDALARAQAQAWLHFEQEHVIANFAAVRFRLLTGRWRPDAPEVVARATAAQSTLDVIARSLAERDWLVGDRPSIADVGLFAYLSRSHQAGIDLAPWPAVTAWLGRVRALDGFVDDLVDYPPNASERNGRSIYG